MIKEIVSNFKMFPNLFTFNTDFKKCAWKDTYNQLQQTSLQGTKLSNRQTNTITRRERAEGVLHSSSRAEERIKALCSLGQRRSVLI